MILHDNSLIGRRDELAQFSALGLGHDFDHEGTPFTAVPHTEQATRILWNMGRNEVPAPMEKSFKWTGRLKPMDHQRKMAGFMSVHEKCFNLSDMGTAKTAAAIWAAEYLMQQGVINKVLVIAPLSTLRRTWLDELFTVVPHRQACIVHGTKKKRTAALSSNSQWLVTNHDGIKTELEAYRDRRDIDLVIVDEFTAYKNPKADRSKCLRAVCRGRRLWMMSATPTAQSPTDAYFPCKLVTPASMPSFTRFRDAVMLDKGFGTFKKWVPRHNANDIVRGYMKPAIRFEKSKVLDLPPVTYMAREVEMGPMQKKMFTALKKDQTAYLQSLGAQVTASQASALASKLLQVAQGVVINDAGAHLELDPKPRLTELTSLIEQAAAKVIVFAPFRGVVSLIEKHLSKRFSVGVVHGGISAGKRDQIYKSFSDKGGIQVLVAHPRTTSHGLTLTSADVTIWFGPVNSVETYIQANQRMNRPGQTNAMTIAHIGATREEWAVYRALQNNTSVQEALLKMYELD
jgi:SNF2 family DNA or RNA helicase